MNNMNNAGSVAKQYEKTDNLDIRIAIHSKYSTNKQGFGNWIYEQYELGNGCRILELGCGSGDMWKEKIGLIGKDSSLILSDFSEGMVEEVRRKYQNYPNVSFERINIEEIPYEDASFDIVIANMMLYHVPDLRKALSEVARVLKTAGKFYSATYGENGIHTYIQSVLQEDNLKGDKNIFTLQNGGALLGRHFNRVVRRNYIDSLEITDTNDLIRYIYSMESILDIKEKDRDRLYEVFENKKDENGIIKIPKEYGLFISGGTTDR